MADPTTVANLRGWWKADGIASPPADGGLLGTWTDSSAGAHPAVQATSGVQPTYRTAGTFLPNGKPVVEFESASPRNMVATVPQAGAVTRFAVIRLKTLTAQNTFASSLVETAVTAAGKFVTAIENVTWLNQNGGVATLTTGAWYILTVTDNGSNLDTTFVDGTQDATSSTAHTNSGTSLSLGTATSSGTPFDGYLAEMLDYSAVLSAADRATVHYYLAEKYGLANADYPGAEGARQKSAMAAMRR